MLDKFHITARRATPTERREPFGRYRRKLAWLIAKRQPFHARHYIKQEGLDFDARLLHVRVKGTVYLDGLWQSENYFKDVEHIIRSDLTIQPCEDSRNREMAARIRDCEAVGVHVRRFSLHHREGAAYELKREYYQEAFRYLEERLHKPHYFVFSDDPDYAAKVLPSPQGRLTFVSHNRGDERAWADLWLMTLCRHFIIANSTFSWWGAWLSPWDGHHVVSPGFVSYRGVTAWGFKGLIPVGWARLPSANGTNPD